MWQNCTEKSGDPGLNPLFMILLGEKPTTMSPLQIVIDTWCCLCSSDREIAPAYGMAHWICDSKGEWMSIRPDMSQCQSVWMRNIRQKLLARKDNKDNR